MLRKNLALALPLLVLLSGEARAALLGDTIKPFASVTETYDSNIFRVKDREQLRALVGDSRMGDLITDTTVGSSFHYGLSSLESNVLLKRDFIHYAHYGSQSANRDEATADASIKLFDRVKIKVDGGYLKEPEARTEFRAPGQNDVTTLQYGILVGYETTSGLGFEAGYRRIGVDYSLKELAPNEYDLDRYTGTVYYRLSPEAKVYATYRRDNRNYREGIEENGVLIRNSNTGDTVRVGMEKTISPKTTVSGEIGYTTRKHDALSGRDFSGPTGKAQIQYGLTSKMAVVLKGERDLYEESYRDQPYSVNTTVGAGLVYQATEKVKATLTDQVTWKNFQNLPGSSAPHRRDVSNGVGAGIEWTPRDRVSVTAGYQYQSRGSSDSSFNYGAHIVSVGVAYKF